MDINVLGVLYSMKHEIPAMLASGGGAIVNTSSILGLRGIQGGSVYNASKFAVNGMTQVAALEYSGEGIRVNSIAPGAIRTPINPAAWSTPESYNDLMKLVPYKRIGEPEDIGRAAVWLASDYADYVNGISLFVDGGMTLYPGFTEGG